MLRLINLSPTDSGSGGGAVDSDDKEASVEQFLLQDDENDAEILDVKDKVDEKEDDKEDEIDEDKEEAKEDTLEDEIEKDLEDVDEEKLELLELPRRKEILKEFPDLFKKFPALERSYFRDQKFTEVFTTPAEAVEANEKAQALDHFERALLSGDTEVVFKSIKDESQEAFYSLVDNLLVNLGKVDEPAQLHVMRNVGKVIIKEMVNEAESSDNPALKQAALILNQFITGSSTYSPPELLSKKTERHPDETRLQQERQQLARERYDGVRTDLISKLDTAIGNTLTKGLDPKDTMPPYLRNAAIRDAKLKIQDLIAKDSRFNAVMRKAWGKAVQSNYSKADVDYIRNAYRNKAQLLLPSVIKTVRSEALRGLARRSSEKDDNIEVREPIKKGPVASGKSAAPGNSGSKNAKDRARAIPTGVSTKDFLMADD